MWSDMILCIKKVFKMFISVNTSSLSHTGDTHKDLYKSVFVAALFIIRKKKQEHKYSTEEWLNKLYIHVSD